MGAKIDNREHLNWTPLHVAMQGHSIEVAKVNHFIYLITLIL